MKVIEDMQRLEGAKSGSGMMGMGTITTQSLDQFWRPIFENWIRFRIFFL